MKLALFDLDAQLLQLARAAARAKQHEVALFCEPGELGAELLPLFPTAVLEADWESLLVAGQFDLLVVGRSQRELAQREELLRRSVQEGVPLVAMQPAAESIVMHELAMIQHDTHSLLLPWNISREHPAAKQLGERVAGKSISQVVLQRGLAETSREQVIAQLARDVGLLQSLVGPLSRVTALGSAGSDKLNNLAVTFAGGSDALVQWILQPAIGEPMGRLTVVADGQQFVLELRSPDEPWQLTTPSSDGPANTEEFELGDAMIRYVERASADPAAPWIVDAWKQACHAAELAEGAQQSLRRGRTIQLHFEEHSEQQTFKGVMAVSGCLVLLLILFALAASAVVDALGLPFRNSAWWRLWPLYVLAPAVLLLAAQSLWRVFATRPR